MTGSMLAAAAMVAVALVAIAVDRFLHRGRR